MFVKWECVEKTVNLLVFRDAVGLLFFSIKPYVIRFTTLKRMTRKLLSFDVFNGTFWGVLRDSPFITRLNRT